MTKQELNKYITLTIIVAVAYLIVSNIQPIVDILVQFIKVLSPFLIGGVIAYILNIPLKKIEKILEKKIKNKSIIRTISITLSLLLFITIILVILLLLIPELIDSFENLIVTVPTLINDTEEWILDLLNKYPDIQKQLEKTLSQNNNLQDILSTILNYLIDGSVGFISDMISSIITVFTAIVFSIYMLSQKEYLVSGVKKIIKVSFKKEVANKIFSITELADKTFNKFISGQCLEACILGLLMFFALSICRFPYALIISVLTAVTALIPVFGAILAMIVGAILIGITNPLQSLLFILVFQIVQQIEGNFIYPKVVGKSVGLSPIWTLLAILVAGNLFGIVGMLVGLPIASITYALLKEAVNSKLKKE